jgi:hypothetical protein
MCRVTNRRARGVYELRERPRNCMCRRAYLGMQKELAAVREENQWLRDSARFFAELAERLNTRLRDDSPSAQAFDR